MEVPAVRIEVMEILPRAPSWVEDIFRYLETNEVPEDRQKAKKIRNRVARYTLIERILYWRGHSAPLLRCISKEEAQYVLAEIHKRACGSHSGGKALAGKVMRVGYYWPRALKDAKKYERKCQKCHEYAKVPHFPSKELASITSSWPFAQWGID
ncbi:uncharacterized protein LOC118348649 [Juglans regia]|uniref:Uncharacterized protein LOC118348649 n=1 Tax=Juglans regia TaxID=51240 RepID=A0A6P9EGK6_JUGRE|nr:uncharacterized protein LOC118348649 [Juglans regia]